MSVVEAFPQAVTGDVKEYEEATPTRRRHSIKKEIGMLVLLLTAETVVGCCMHNTNDGHLNVLMTVVKEQHHEAEMNKQRTAMLNEEVDSSEGDSDTVDLPTPTDFQSAPVASTTLFSGNRVVLMVVASFLPWKDALNTRGVSRQWLAATETTAAIFRMPQTDIPAVFIPCTKDLGADEPFLQYTWERAGVDPHLKQARMFLGQLRRLATVPFVQWLLNVVVGAPAALLKVENHRHKLTGRGKGCAWVYIDDSYTRQLFSLHHRCFFDTIRGVEGLWIVPPKSIDHLRLEIDTRCYNPRHPRHMPRTALVAELPATAAPPPPSYQQYFEATFVSTTSPSSVYYTNSKGQQVRRNNPYALA